MDKRGWWGDHGMIARNNKNGERSIDREAQRATEYFEAEQREVEKRVGPRYPCRIPVSQIGGKCFGHGCYLKFECEAYLATRNGGTK